MTKKALVNTKEEVINQIEAMREELLTLTSEMVQIPSINPSYDGVDKVAVLGGEKKSKSIYIPNLKKSAMK